MDFIQDPLLWPKLMTRYRATHTIAPHFGYQLTARRMELAGPQLDLDLSSLTFLDYHVCDNIRLLFSSVVNDVDALHIFTPFFGVMNIRI